MKADELYSVINGVECQLNILKNNADKLLNEAYLCGKADQQKETADHHGCVGCKYEDVAQEHYRCHACCNAYINRWTAKPQEDDEIKVGDEVRYKFHNTTWTAVVTKREGNVIYLMGRGGCVAEYSLSNFEKTGRHFDIESILEEMKR